MNRITIFAATAAVLFVLVGGAVLLSSGGAGPSETTTPSSAAPPSSVPATPMASSAAPPEPALQSAWVANAPAGSASSLLRLTIGSAAAGNDPTLLTVMDASSLSVLARVTTGQFGDLFVAAPDPIYGCQTEDVGRYTHAIAAPSRGAAEGYMWLELTAKKDACAERQAILERTWTRVFTTGFVGGRAVAINFDPMFMVTLPAGAWGVSASHPDLLLLDTIPDGGPVGAGFSAWRNPAGFTDPCSRPGGPKIPVAHTIDAFAAYLESLPGVSVQRTDLEIDGLPAAHLTLSTEVTDDCSRPDHQVWTWTPSDPSDPVRSVMFQGESTDSIYLVEVGEELFLFDWGTYTLPEDPNVRPTRVDDTAAEIAVVSTLEFIDTIPPEPG